MPRSPESQDLNYNETSDGAPYVLPAAAYSEERFEWSCVCLAWSCPRITECQDVRCKLTRQRDRFDTWSTKVSARAGVETTLPGGGSRCEEFSDASSVHCYVSHFPT